MSKITLTNDDGTTVDFIQVVSTDEQDTSVPTDSPTGEEVATPPTAAVEEVPATEDGASKVEAQ